MAHRSGMTHGGEGAGTRAGAAWGDRYRGPWMAAAAAVIALGPMGEAAGMGSRPSGQTKSSLQGQAESPPDRSAPAKKSWEGAPSMEMRTEHSGSVQVAPPGGAGASVDIEADGVIGE